MDILSCLVGVMLFLVIYTVLELGNAAFQLEMPGLRSPPPGSRPVIVVAAGGTVRVMDVEPPLRGLLAGFGTVSFAEAPELVRRANERGLSDDFFGYSLSYSDRVSAIGARSRAIELSVAERPGATGEDARQLDAGSRFAAALGRLDPRESWLRFAVDGESLDVFRRARTIALERGFTTGWEPLAQEFPLRYTLSGMATGELVPTTSPPKPER